MGDGDKPKCRVVLLGPPGCGKGTQAAILSQILGIPAIATGDMLRAAVAAGTELGTTVAGVMAAGDLVDDDLMGAVVRERLGDGDVSEGFLLDGYPRTTAQADTLAAVLTARGASLDHVIFLRVPEEVLVARATGRQRQDDREDVVRERLRVYREKTEPVIGYYDKQGLLTEVDGDRRVEEITPDIVEILKG